MVLFFSTQDEEYVGLLSSAVVSSPAHVALDKKRIKAFLKGYQLKWSFEVSSENFSEYI